MKPAIKQFKKKKPKLQKKEPIFINGLNRYNETSDDQPWVKFKIVVPTEYDKEQLLLAFKYIHDIWELDTGYIAVNALAHSYMHPDIIVVQSPNE